MKVFLSSTVRDLRDARAFLIEKMKQKCHNDIDLIHYEGDITSKPELDSEKACLSLVKDCKAFIILFDQYYGGNSKTHPGISITHAELREAVKFDLVIIPVVRTNTWCEYNVWKNNRTSKADISYAHVIEPKLFDMIHEVSGRPCHIYDSFVGDEALTKIAEALDAIIFDGIVGTMSHTTLSEATSTTSLPIGGADTLHFAEPVPVYPHNPSTASRPTAGAKPPPHGKSAFSFIAPRFKPGQQLTHNDMNLLCWEVSKAAKRNGLDISPLITWTAGSPLTPEQMNQIISDIDTIYEHTNLDSPNWSFGPFKTGGALTADHLNEIWKNLGVFLK